MRTCVCTHAPSSDSDDWSTYPHNHDHNHTTTASAVASDGTRGAMDDHGVRWRRRLAETEGDGAGHAAEGGHGGAMNVFAMALSGMDQVEIGWMMVAVIFAQLVLDEALRRVEASVGPNARACLREVYKELSTVSLGAVWAWIRYIVG